MLTALQNHIADRLPFLNGAWVSRNSAYESDLCQALHMGYATSRYWDALWNGHALEFKKGTSIWVDLVRYSEILLGLNAEAKRETHCLFFIPRRDRLSIKEVACVKTTDLLTLVRITDASAQTLLDLRREVPHSLNAQASLTVADIKRIATFVAR